MVTEFQHCEVFFFPDVQKMRPFSCVARLADAGVQRELVLPDEEVHNPVHLDAPRHGQSFLRQVRSTYSFRLWRPVLRDIPAVRHRSQARRWLRLQWLHSK